MRTVGLYDVDIILKILKFSNVGLNITISGNVSMRAITSGYLKQKKGGKMKIISVHR